MKMFANYLKAESSVNLFGEPVNDEGRALNAATRMYGEARRGGASAMAAYAMMQEEAGTQLADVAAAAYRGGFEAPMYQPEMTGWTHRDRVLREAGLLDD